AQVFMENQFDGLIGSPFAAADEILQNAPKSDIIIVDFHSEATSEKRGFGFYLDGKVSAVLGTHTHVQTADAQVLPGGTAYISDAGMCGAADSVLGVKPELALERMLTGKKVPLEGKETEESEVGYVVMDIDEANGKAREIKAYLERVRI
ncbi:MAG: YmdB family metallophosphoesterase, partial [bacterium]|nr:YmdB family metallophosphoesterase [bacterium]